MEQGNGRAERTKQKKRVSTRWRQQANWKILDLERVLGAEHKARTIVELIRRMDMSGFLDPIRSTEHGPGRGAEDPALLLCLWVYGYSEGIGSAHESSRGGWNMIRRCCGFSADGKEAVCHSKLSEFRTGHPAALGKLGALWDGYISQFRHHRAEAGYGTGSGRKAKPTRV